MTDTAVRIAHTIDEHDLLEEIARTERILAVLCAAPQTSVMKHGRQLYERRLHVLRLSHKRLQRYRAVYP